MTVNDSSLARREAASTLTVRHCPSFAPPPVAVVAGRPLPHPYGHPPFTILSIRFPPAKNLSSHRSLPSIAPLTCTIQTCLSQATSQDSCLCFFTSLRAPGLEDCRTPRSSAPQRGVPASACDPSRTQVPFRLSFYTFFRSPR
jgi:hypothetical protein